MPPKEFELRWSPYKPFDDILAKVDYIEQTDAGLKIHYHKVEKEKKMNKLQGQKIDKIEIVRNGDTVIARAFQEDGKLYHDLYGEVKKGYLLINEAAAKCGPNDIFDFNIGAKLAFDRLYEGYDMTPKPKRKPYNGLIYIEKYPGAALKNKSVYRVKDGVIQKCKFGARPFIYYGMSDEELSTEIDDVVWGRNTVNSCLIPGEENKYPLTVAHFVDNDKT